MEEETSQESYLRTCVLAGTQPRRHGTVVTPVTTVGPRWEMESVSARLSSPVNVATVGN